jgi:ubiquinone/menaquinone biosynthesis C-methylase UbiE
VVTDGGCVVIPNQQQFDAWNGPESIHYVDHADRYDRQLAPVTEALLERAGLEPDHRVLDVGSGSGATTLAAAQVAARVLGVDISEPLTEVARERARGVGGVEFLVADAQTHPFEADGFEVIISQFGLMFFDDPDTAFTNLRRSLATDGRIVFTTWRCLDDNEWLQPVASAVAEHAELPELGGLANGGGMFAMKERLEIADLLERTGFTDVTVTSLSPSLVVGGGGSADDCAAFLMGMGIVRGLLSRLDDARRALATEAVRAELAARHETGVGVRLNAGVWVVEARAAAS